MKIITEILSKLPVKSLLRFCCVSKLWNSLIKDPHFIKLHLQNSSLNNTNQTLIIRNSDIRSLDFPEFNHVNLIDHPLNTPNLGTELLGSCNGLICLSNGEEEGINGTIFYNPGTRTHHEIPASEIEFPKRFTWCERTVYGFGYDHVNEDYKLLRIIQFDGFDEFDSEVKIYSLKLCSWRKLECFPREYYLTLKRAWGVYVSGCLHWVVTRKPESDGSKMIFAFDLGSEGCNFVSIPECLDDEVHMNVDALNGCLCVLSNYEGVRSELWVMKEYGVKESWMKLFSIVQGGVVGYFEYVRAIAYSNDGLSVLIEQDGKRLFWFDLERQTVENVEVPGSLCLMDSALIVESLVPLECRHKTKIVKPKLKEKKYKQRRKEGWL